MKNNDEEQADMDSIPLFDYLKKQIPVEEIRDYASPKRIISIDVVKGFAIIFIMFAHTAGSWLNMQWKFVYGVAFAFLDILGPSLFVFLSALSVVFSIRKKQGRVPYKVLRNGILTRGLIIIIIGVIFNITSYSTTVKGYSFPFNLWGWNILLFIGFSQIFSLYALRLGKITRSFIGLIIIFTSDAVRQYLYNLKESGNILGIILHYILVSPVPMTPIIPWLSICFLSTIFGEYLYEAMIGGKKQDYVYLCRLFLAWGIILVGIGIFLGRGLYVPGTEWINVSNGSVGVLPISEYPHLDLFSVINSQVFFPQMRWAGLWEFLIRGRGSNMIYNLGAALLIISIWFYIVDLKKKSNIFISMLKYYGKISLSLFLLHYIFVTLFYGFFDIVFFIIICLGYTGFWGFLMYLWNEFFDGKGSPEWLMVQIGRIGQKTTHTVKKEIHIIEEEIKGTVQKLKEK
jgi:uncharacterized membrane protein